MDTVKVAILDRIVGSSRYDILITEKECIDELKTAIPLRLNKTTALGVLWREFWLPVDSYYSGFHSTMLMEHLCQANFLHRSDEQFKCKLQQMPLRTPWKKN